ncbi:hypothetical protein BJV74DRAFT_861953 [Russula compacta]|nr:hypothetical protein BJV74DRAFT_861953 [Russula compacta]
MRSRVNFFEAVDGRILELSRIRARFVDSRQIFREQPNKLLAQGIQDAKGHVHEGYLSRMKPLFDKIDKYYREVNVSLRVEEECLKKIRSSFRVTPDDKFRWEYIRDACKEASALLISETPPLPPYMPEPIKNKAARNINVLAQTVTEARHSLRQTHRNIADLTQHPQFGLLRLQTEYKNSEQTCREKIDEVLQFSESFLRSFVEVPARDDFRDYLLPSAAASSSHILQEVGKQVGKKSFPDLYLSLAAFTVLRALPQLQGLFTRFNSCLPSATRRCRGIVQPLEQPNDPHYGVLRTMKPVQLGEDQRNWGGLSEQWQRSYSTFRHDNVIP